MSHDGKDAKQHIFGGKHPIQHGGTRVQPIKVEVHNV